MKRAALGIAACVLAIAALGSRQASAHAALVTADPAPNSFVRTPPAQLTLRFSEPVEQRLTRARVIDSAGQDVAAGEARFPDEQALRLTLPRLEPGFYSVAWENVSKVDGHGLSGSFPFTVLQADGSVPAGVPAVGAGARFDQGPRGESVAVRWMLLLGLSGMAGIGCLLVFGGEAVAVRRGLVVAAVSAAALAVAGAALSLALVVGEYEGLAFTQVMADTQPGRQGLLRLGVLGVGLAIAVQTRRGSRAWALGTIAAAVGAMFTLSATSHAAAADGYAWGQVIDWLHGTAAVTWIGGVIGVAVAARLSISGGGLEPRLLRRFSTMASGSVFVLLSSGLLESLIHVRSSEQLVDTRYGGWLLVKLSLLVPLLALAFYNSRWGVAGPGTRAGTGRLARTAGVEALVGIAVFALAAGLSQVTTAASLPPETGAQASRVEAIVDDVAVTLTTDPNRTGFNAFSVRVIAPPPAGAVSGVRLGFTYLDDSSVGPATLELLPSPDGTFNGAGPYLPLEGNWEVEAFVRFANRDDLRARLRLRPAGALYVAGDARGAWHNPAATLFWNQFGGLAILSAGVGLYLAARRLRPALPVAGRAASVSGVACIGFAAMLLFGVHRDVPPAGISANPIAADRNSVETGARLYEANCARCHGVSGVPPRGLELDPYPLDLTVHAPLHPDGILFRFIADGVPGSAMVAWSKVEPRLSEEEIWHLVNFLRTLRPAEE